jgi:hypothetical protein
VKDQPPRPETRKSIERALVGRPRRQHERMVRIALGMPRHSAEIEADIRRNSRRRPPGMAPALVEPPRGPQPLAGGAAAPLTFERD